MPHKLVFGIIFPSVAALLSFAWMTLTTGSSVLATLVLGFALWIVQIIGWLFATRPAASSSAGRAQAVDSTPLLFEETLFLGHKCPRCKDRPKGLAFIRAIDTEERRFQCSRPGRGTMWHDFDVRPPDPAYHPEWGEYGP